MATARKLPSGSWRVRVYAGKDASGHKVYESFTADTKKEAERDAAQWLLVRKERTNNPASFLTVGQTMDEYIETCRSGGKSPQTIVGYEVIRRNGFKSIEHIKLSMLTLRDIQKTINERKADHSSKTLVNSVSFLKSSIGKYCDLDFRKLSLPKNDRDEMNIPTDAEAQALIQAAKEKDRDLYICIILSATMGLRRSECCALRWSDIDTETNEITVNKAAVEDAKKNVIIKSTKTRAGRRKLAADPAVISELMSMRIPNEKDDDRIIKITPYLVTNRFMRLRDKQGVNCRFHDLRHYHASIMLALNAPMAYIVRDLGHATPDMVNRVYGHIVEKRKTVINEAVGKHASALIKGEKTAFSDDV